VKRTDAENRVQGLLIGLTSGLLVTQAGIAAPQDSVDNAPALEEVIVTAQKRSESSMDVPIAITAATSEMLKAHSVSSTYELPRLSPGLTWNDAGGAGSNIGLRGMVDVNFTTGTVGSVGIVVDEVGRNSPVANRVGLLDVERIEILRGPQVALYGRSTTGGAINFVSRRPKIGAETEGSVATSFGNYGQLDVETAFGAPIGDSSALRVAARWENRDGIFDNMTLKTTDSDRRRSQARVSFLTEPSEQFSALASAHFYDQDGQSVRYKSYGLFDPRDPSKPCTAPIKAGNGCADAFGFIDNGDFRKNYSELPSPIEKVRLAGASLNLRWQLPSMSITSISAVDETRFSRNEDTDGTPTSAVDVSIDADIRQFSQEIRLASSDDADFRWLAGLFYLKEKQQGITTVAVRFVDVFLATAYDQTDTILSAYGQVDWTLNPRWSLTAGLRYSDETKKGTGTGLDAFDDLVGRGIPAPGVFIDEAVARRFADSSLTAVVPFDRTWKDVGGKLGLNFRPSESTLLYGSVSRGFKGGAINLAAGPVLADPTDAAAFARGVNPESLLTYEIGAKTTVLNRRLELSGAVFANDLTDQQLFIVLPSGAVYLLNAAKASVRGVEGEFRWRATEGLTVSGGASWLDDEYKKLVNGGADLSGNRMVQVPKYTANLSLRQEWQVSGGQIAAILGLQATGDQYFDLSNRLREDAHSLVDAQVEYTFGRNVEWRVAAWLKNAADERFCVNAADIGTNVQCVPNEPRLYGLTIGARF
jgi:iron complex outermembrane recepter protein